MRFRRKPKLPLEVRRLRVNPGDSLLVTVPANMSMDQVVYVRDCFRGRFDGAEVLIVSDDIDITVVEKP